MKIEKLNDNQIRCTLTKEDFESRQLNLNELAYGSDKAKTLFREMMSKAYQEFGFNVENIPLMVEAIPMSGEGITLIITKVSDPEELDTRFSRFSTKGKEEDNATMNHLLDLYHKFMPKDETPAILPSKKEETKEEKSTQTSLEKKKHTTIYEFDQMDTLIYVSKLILPIFKGESQLFFEQENQHLFLFLTIEEEEIKEFYKISNLLSDYSLQSSSPKEMSYIYEHSQKLIEMNALKELSKL